MFRFLKYAGLTLCAVFLFSAIVFAEDITITTYYPSPYGVYDSLQTDKLGVGDNNGDGILSSADVPVTSGDVWIKGNLGIGKSPGYKLDVAGNVNVDGQLITKGTVSGWTTSITTYAKNGIYPSMGDNFTINTGPTFMGGGAHVVLNPDLDGGHVGIGNANPQAILDVAGVDTTGIRYLKSGSKDARIQLGDPTKRWSLAVGWATAGDLTIIEEGVAGDRLYIKQGGNVGIGRTPLTNKLEVEGAASKTVAGTWLANSDKRIKTDIYSITNAVDTLGLLRPVKFKYTDEYKAKHPSITDKYYYNFIAQEFQKVFPTEVMVTNDTLPNGEYILAIDPYVVTPYLVKAIAEQQDIIKSQQLEIKGLKARLEKLERK